MVYKNVLGTAEEKANPLLYGSYHLLITCSDLLLQSVTFNFDLLSSKPSKVLHTTAFRGVIAHFMIIPIFFSHCNQCLTNFQTRCLGGESLLLNVIALFRCFWGFCLPFVTILAQQCIFSTLTCFNVTLGHDLFLCFLKGMDWRSSIETTFVFCKSWCIWFLMLGITTEIRISKMSRWKLLMLMLLFYLGNQCSASWLVFSPNVNTLEMYGLQITPFHGAV